MLLTRLGPNRYLYILPIRVTQKHLMPVEQVVQKRRDIRQLTFKKVAGGQPPIKHFRILDLHIESFAQLIDLLRRQRKLLVISVFGDAEFSDDVIPKPD